jgi:hypothetical protein
MALNKTKRYLKCLNQLSPISLRNSIQTIPEILSPDLEYSKVRIDVAWFYCRRHHTDNLEPNNTYKTSTSEECRWAKHPHTSLKTPQYFRVAIRTTCFLMKTKVYLRKKNYWRCYFWTRIGSEPPSYNETVKKLLISGGGGRWEEVGPRAVPWI